MKFEIKLVINLNDLKIKDIPYFDDNLDKVNSFWTKELVKDHFKGNLTNEIENLLISKSFEDNYISNLMFEDVETLEDLNRNFGLTIEVLRND